MARLCRDVQPYRLDDVDRQLLSLLQENARRKAVELGDAVGVSDNTIHNRMAQLEEAGVITGYTTTLDYDSIGLDFYFLFVCSARISERAVVAEEAREIPEVVEVVELMTGERNLHIKVAGTDRDDITRVAQQLDGLNLEINDESFVRSEQSTPLDLVAIEEMLDRE